MSVVNRADEIRKKLSSLRNLDPGLTQWGASHHKYLLHPRATEREVLRYEKEYGVAFPPEYRTFLLELGNGGAGPGVGLYSLKQSFLSFEKDAAFLKERKWPRQRLDHPFPMSGAVAQWLCDVRRHKDGTPTDAYYEVRKTPKITMLSPADGALEITNESCCSLYLIVTGELRGKIWSCGEDEWLPADDGTKPVGFLDWYENWLDGTIKWLSSKNGTANRA